MRSPLKRLSFQMRLLLSIILVVILATVAGYLFIDHSVKRAFSDFTVRNFSRQDQLVLGMIDLYYREAGTLDGFAEHLSRRDLAVSVLLVDPDRRVTYSPEERLVGMRLSESQVSEGLPLVLPSGETWTVLPYRFTPGRGEIETTFLQTTRRSLWLAGLSAGLAGVLLAFLLLRQLMTPLKRLADAAHRIAEGDLTKRVEVASSDEIGYLGQSFNDMASSLEAAEEAKKRMIADVSHELRTPLTAVRSALEALRDGLIEPTQETFANLHNRLVLFTRLVNDLHQLALADSGRLSIHRSPCHLSAIVEGIVDTIGAQLEDAGLSLDEQIDPRLPVLDVDGQRIEQIMLNLLANAIRHTPDGGRISISAATAENREVVVSVCDSGPGLAPSDVAHVFDRFYQADDARTRTPLEAPAKSPEATAGAGLGLSIAKALVEAHGGRIWVENASGGGACFRFALPIDAASTASIPRVG